MTAIAHRMIKNVTPENGYDFLRADDKPCGWASARCGRCRLMKQPVCP
ncbi:hypothetical protein [Verrucomicrobium spinosum]|nr:hypothetical protein [Verrucomicrobium spinosum]